MSSMWRIAVFLPVVLLATAPSSSAQYRAPTGPVPAYAPVAAPSIATSLNDWRTLRQSSNYRFADYARFLIANPDWPDDAKMRRWAEKGMQPGENAATVLAFFATDKPASANGWARLADAYAANARMAEALSAAREAWVSPDLGATDQQAIWNRYGGSLTRADHDRRVDALLFAKKTDDAARFLAMATPQRQAAFGARIAMQRNSADAESRYQGVMAAVTTDPGLMMDRARYLRGRNYGQAARDLAAREHHFAYPAADPERFYDMLLTLASEAAQARHWSTAYNISRHLRDALPPGADISTQSYDVRDRYTDLAWLGGNVALDRLNKPDAAVALFDAYSQGGHSLQVQTKGLYWAGPPRWVAGHVQEANAYFQRAAAYTDLFYGQLALERLGRSVNAPPPKAVPQYVTTAAQRAAFNNRRTVQALRMLGPREGSADQVAVDLDPERRELHRHVGLELLGRNGVERPLVLGRGQLGLPRVADELAQHVDGGHRPAPVQRPHGRDGIVQRLAGDVAVGDPAHDRARHDRQRGREQAVDGPHRSSSSPR